MGDVFGNKSGRSGGSQGSGSGPGEARVVAGPAQSTYLQFDNESGEMTVVLPPHVRHHARELIADLQQEFFLANPDEGTFATIDEFIEDWLVKKGEEIG